MRRLFAVGVVAALAWIAPPVGADAPKSLGEVAAKDKDKKKPAKVYTEDDLHNSKHTGTVSQPAAEGTTTPAAGAADTKKDGEKTAPGDKVAPSEKPKTEDELHADAEKEWRDKLTQAQADVNTWTGEVNRLQTALNDNTGAMYGPGRAAKADALENAKRQLATATQTVADLQEQGRRNRYH
jgi:hypothetical protein